MGEMLSAAIWPNGIGVLDCEIDTNTAQFLFVSAELILVKTLHQHSRNTYGVTERDLKMLHVAKLLMELHGVYFAAGFLHDQGVDIRHAFQALLFPNSSNSIEPLALLKKTSKIDL